MVRAFAAVSVEAPDVLAALDAAQDGLGRIPGVKWVAPHQLHFTLKFLGEIAGNRVAAAGAALEEAAVSRPAFELSFEGLGVFPPRGDARVLWAGCGSGREALEALAASVESALVRMGFPPEKRPFAAHLTLARVKEPGAGRELVRRLASLGSPRFGASRVEEAVLFRSELSSGGPTYTALLRARLAG